MARARARGIGVVVALGLAAALAAGPAASQKEKGGGLATSPRDPLQELQGRLTALEQQNRDLAARLAKLEGALAVSPSGVTLKSPGALKLQASLIEASAATASFKGVVKAETVFANTVSAKTMTPAAGNIW